MTHLKEMWNRKVKRKETGKGKPKKEKIKRKKSEVTIFFIKKVEFLVKNTKWNKKDYKKEKA